MVGSVKRGSATGKRRVLGGVLFARDGIEKPKNSTRIRTAGQVRTGGLPDCRFGSGNDGGRPTRSIYVSEAMHLRSLCLGAGPSSFQHCRFRFLGPPGFGERPRWPKRIEALAALTKKREKEQAAWWMLSASTSSEGRCSAIYD